MRYDAMIRYLTALLAVAIVVPNGSLAAQNVTLGDDVRLRTSAENPWQEGQLLEVTDDQLTIAQGTERVHYKLSEIEEADYWEPANPALLLLETTAAGLAFTALNRSLSDDPMFQEPVADYGFSAGLGLVTGLVLWAIDPADNFRGDWEDWNLGGS